MRSMLVGWGLWLALVAVDGVAGLILGGTSPLSLLIWLGLPPLLLASVVTPRVPARLVWPVAAFAVWSAAFAMPVPLWVSSFSGFVRTIAGTQIGLAVGLMAVAWAMREEDRPLWDLRRSLRHAALLGIGGPLLVVGYIYAATHAGLQALSGGYLELTPRGLVSVERTFEHDDTTVHLIGMVHIGNAEAYEALIASFETLDAVVLLEEGVTDREGRIPERRSYAPSAEAMGLSAQPRLAPEGVVVHHADVDVSTLSPEVLGLIDSALAVWTNPGSVGALLTVQQQMAAGGDPDAWFDALYGELIEGRNAHLLGELRTVRHDYDHVLVPWGAAHLPGIEAALRAEGFTPVGDAVERPLLSW